MAVEECERQLQAVTVGAPIGDGVLHLLARGEGAPRFEDVASPSRCRPRTFGAPAHRGERHVQRAREKLGEAGVIAAETLDCL